ncbi:MAG: hypothetical protein LBJ00_05285 [Planctomycetaceae bacterium]|nr:hypothetical protein [Planctomycetaceae bacterium]
MKNRNLKKFRNCLPAKKTPTIKSEQPVSKKTVATKNPILPMNWATILTSRVTMSRGGKTGEKKNLYTVVAMKFIVTIQSIEFLSTTENTEFTEVNF